MATRYAERVVIVTGGTLGIGRACVETFAEAGAHVVFCSHVRDHGDALACDVTAAGPGLAEFEVCDVTDTEALAVFIEGTAARLGRIHPASSALTQEVVAKLSRGIDPDSQPRWG